jgi:hypothetical protein
VSTAGTVPRGDSRPGEARPSRRVVLLSESAGLAAVLTRLLDRRDQLTRIGWSREVVEQGEFGNADLVVLDVPRAGRIAAVNQLGRHYQGPVVVLVERGDNGRRLPPDQARTLLARPFSTDELTAALGLPGPGTGEDRGTPEATRDRADRRPGATRPSLSTALPSLKRPRPGAPSAADAPATLAGKAPNLIAPPAGTGGVVSMFPPPPPAVDDRAARRPAGPVAGRPIARERRAAGVGGTAAAVEGSSPVIDTRTPTADGKAAARQAPPRPGAQPGATPPEPAGRNRLAALFARLVHGWRARRAVRIAGFAGLAAAAFVVAFALAAQGRCGPGCDALTGIITPSRTLPAAGSPAAPTTTARKPPPSTTPPPSGSGYRGAVPGGALASTTSTTRRATTTTRRPSATTRPSPTSAPTTATTLPPTTATTLPPTTTTTP